MSKQPPVITIDGPSGTGKGTLCALLAQQLGWHQLDSGVIYRLLALETMQHALDIYDLDPIVQRALQLDFYVENQHVYLAKHDVTQAIRSEACGQMASKISAHPRIREALLARQRAYLKPPGLVTDGRDMGTVVFPDAMLKFFLTASVEARTERRFLQLQAQHIDLEKAQIHQELIERDERDRTRAHSPLIPAADAILIDTTTLSIQEVLASILSSISADLE